jgi:oligoribonuclease
MLGIFLDIETNGLNPFKHRAIEIAFQIIDLKNSSIKSCYESIIYQPPYIWEKSDNSSLQINGFTWQKVAMGVSEAIVCREIIHIFNGLNIKRGNSLFVCQNPSFDRGFFSQIVDVDIQEKYQWPYHWLDLASMYWTYNYHDQLKNNNFTLKDGLSKDEIAQSLGLESESKPHKAMNGVKHLLLCYNKILNKSFCLNEPSPL